MGNLLQTEGEGRTFQHQSHQSGAAWINSHCEESEDVLATRRFSGKLLTDWMSKTLSWKREHGSIVCRAFMAALPLFPVSYSCVHQQGCDTIIWPVASKVRIEREGKQSELSPADEQDFSQTSTASSMSKNGEWISLLLLLIKKLWDIVPQQLHWYFGCGRRPACLLRHSVEMTDQLNQANILLKCFYFNGFK